MVYSPYPFEQRRFTLGIFVWWGDVLQCVQTFAKFSFYSTDCLGWYLHIYANIVIAKISKKRQLEEENGKYLLSVQSSSKGAILFLCQIVDANKIGVSPESGPRGWWRQCDDPYMLKFVATTSHLIGQG